MVVADVIMTVGMLRKLEPRRLEATVQAQRAHVLKVKNHDVPAETVRDQIRSVTIAGVVIGNLTAVAVTAFWIIAW